MIGHTLMLLFFGWQLSASMPVIDLGEVESTAIPSYLHQEKERVTSTPAKVMPAKPLAEAMQPSPLKTRTDRQQKKSSHAELSSSAPPSPVQQSVAGNGRPISELVALLHAAIQQQQRYPLSAMQMEREGKVTLHFILFPNGNIQGLKIIKASGTAALDEAALAAVNDALPFKGVRDFLITPEAYQVTVVFELT